MPSPLPPGALPWYHPRRVVDDAATVGVIVALTFYWLFASATNALGRRDEVEETRERRCSTAAERRTRASGPRRALRSALSRGASRFRSTPRGGRNPRPA